MKEDVPDLPAVPRKRRAIESALDLHIAMWLDGDLRPADRRNLEAEKQRRKARVPEKTVGVLVASAGATPEQSRALGVALQESHATAVTHLWQAGRVPGVCRRTELPVAVLSETLCQGPQDLIRDSNETIVLVSTPTRQPYSAGGAWGWIGYARHRGLPVTVIWPDGRTEGVQ